MQRAARGELLCPPKPVLGVGADTPAMAVSTDSKHFDILQIRLPASFEDNDSHSLEDLQPREQTHSPVCRSCCSRHRPQCFWAQWRLPLRRRMAASSSSSQQPQLCSHQLHRLTPLSPGF